MILAKNNVPDVYTESEDFLSVLRLLDLVSNSEHCMNKINKVVDPLLCPYEYLPHLAKRMGYDYDTSIPVKDNKIIMSSFPLMIKNKGNILGIEIAVKTSIKLSDHIALTYTGPTPYVIEKVTKSLIKISIKCKKFSKKLHDLIEYVRPVGVRVLIMTLLFEQLTTDNALTLSTYSEWQSPSTGKWDNFWSPRIVKLTEKPMEMREAIWSTVENEDGVDVVKYSLAIKKVEETTTLWGVTVHARVLIGSSSGQKAQDIIIRMKKNIQEPTASFLSVIREDNETSLHGSDWYVFGSPEKGYGFGNSPTQANVDEIDGYYVVTFKLKLVGDNNVVFQGFERGYVETYVGSNYNEITNTYAFNSIDK